MKMEKFRNREITHVPKYDGDILSARRKRCAAFKASIKKTAHSVRRFSQLAGVPKSTIYIWTSPSDRCIPPPAIAERFAWVLENFPDVAAALEEEFIRDDH